MTPKEKNKKEKIIWPNIIKTKTTEINAKSGSLVALAVIIGQLLRWKIVGGRVQLRLFALQYSQHDRGVLTPLLLAADLLVVELHLVVVQLQLLVLAAGALAQAGAPHARREALAVVLYALRPLADAAADVQHLLRPLEPPQLAAEGERVLLVDLPTGEVLHLRVLLPVQAVAAPACGPADVALLEAPAVEAEALRFLTITGGVGRVIAGWIGERGLARDDHFVLRTTWLVERTYLLD